MNQVKITGTKLTKEVVQKLQFEGQQLVLPNIYAYDWESDVFSLCGSNFMVSEYEIKVSESDYHADFNKTGKHKMFSAPNPNKKELAGPNYFWYVVPKDLIDEGQVPAYAGLMYYMGKPGWFKIVKQAPLLHKAGIGAGMWEEIAMKLYRKFC